MFLIDILTVHIFFVYLFLRNYCLEIVDFICVAQSEGDKVSVLMMGTLWAMAPESILGSCHSMRLFDSFNHNSSEVFLFLYYMHWGVNLVHCICLPILCQMLVAQYVPSIEFICFGQIEAASAVVKSTIIFL